MNNHGMKKLSYCVLIIACGQIVMQGEEASSPLSAQTAARVVQAESVAAQTAQPSFANPVVTPSALLASGQITNRCLALNFKVRGMAFPRRDLTITIKNDYDKGKVTLSSELLKSDITEPVVGDGVASSADGTTNVHDIVRPFAQNFFQQLFAGSPLEFLTGHGAVMPTITTKSDNGKDETVIKWDDSQLSNCTITKHLKDGCQLIKVDCDKFTIEVGASNDDPLLFDVQHGPIDLVPVESNGASTAPQASQSVTPEAATS